MSAGCLADRDGSPLATGLAAAAAGCLLGSFGGRRVRAVTAEHDVPDLPVALAEDTVAVAAAWWAVS